MVSFNFTKYNFNLFLGFIPSPVVSLCRFSSVCGRFCCFCPRLGKKRKLTLQQLTNPVVSNATVIFWKLELTFLFQGRRRCVCKAGFYKVGSSCRAHRPMSPCAINHGGCSVHADCTDNGKVQQCALYIPP